MAAGARGIPHAFVVDSNNTITFSGAVSDYIAGRRNISRMYPIPDTMSSSVVGGAQSAVHHQCPTNTSIRLGTVRKVV